METCFKERKSMEKISDLNVIVVKDGALLFLESLKDDTKQYTPCNLPEKYNNGDKITVTITLKEIFPHERWAGHPCIIHDIKDL